MFGAVLEKNIRHAYRRPQTRKIELSTNVIHVHSPIVLFQTWLKLDFSSRNVGTSDSARATPRYSFDKKCRKSETTCCTPV
jgi:hypothetical protein